MWHQYFKNNEDTVWHIRHSMAKPSFCGVRTSCFKSYQEDIPDGEICAQCQKAHNKAINADQNGAGQN